MRQYRYIGLRKTLGMYLVIGAAGLTGFATWQSALAGFFTSLPGFAILLVILFYFVAGIQSTRRPATRIADYTLRVALLLQAAGFSIAGLYFRCSFAPVAGISFSNVTRSLVGFEWRPFAFGFSAGYEAGVEAVSFSVNILPVLLLVMLAKDSNRNDDGSRNSKTRP